MSDPTAPNPKVWKRCNMCKKEIAWGALYWVCNVSTCNRKRTGLIFCSVTCWDAHVPGMNHKESWAEERRSPKFGEVAAQTPKKAKADEPSAEPHQNPFASSGVASGGAPKVILRRK